jgi:hypothetical protein
MSETTTNPNGTNPDQDQQKKDAGQQNLPKMIKVENKLGVELVGRNGDRKYRILPGSSADVPEPLAKKWKERIARAERENRK